MAGVVDGQAVSAAVTNAAFLYKNANDSTLFKLSIGGTSTAGQFNVQNSSDTNQLFDINYPDSSTVLLIATRAATGNNQALRLSGQAGVQVYANAVAIATFGTGGGLTFADTTKGPVGTTTNDNATAGYYGEFASVNSPTGGTATPAASGSYANVASMSLTAGDWDVCATIEASLGGTFAGTLIQAAISKSSGTTDSIASGGIANIRSASLVNNASTFLPVMTRRITLTTTTTVYLVGALVYSTLGATTWGANSFMSARRIR